MSPKLARWCGGHYCNAVPVGYRFDQDTAVTPLGGGRYGMVLSGEWSIRGALHGGYLLATACQAALAGGPHPDLLAVAANYLRTPQPGPAEAAVQHTRAGRRVSYSRVLLSQGGEPVLDAVVTAGTLTAEAPQWTELSMPDHPGPEAGLGTAPGGHPFPMASIVEMRLDPRMPWLSGRPGGPVRMAGWLRFADGRPADALGLLFFADMLPPATFAQGKVGWVPTVQMNVFVRAAPAPGWCWVVLRGGMEVAGFLDEQVEVWDAAGRLVAQGRQLAVAPRELPG
jgi:acyl-CoA thioesterase